MRKLIPIISILMLFTYSLLGQTATVSIPDTTAPNGSEVLIPLNIGTLDDVGSATLRVLYDNSVLTYSGEIENNALTGGNFITNVEGDSLILISWFSLTPVDLNGKILDLKFVYNGGTSDIKFFGANELADEFANPYTVTFVDGSIGPQPAAMELSDERGVTGDTLTVELTASNLENVGAMNIYIDYDTAAVEYLGLGSINEAGFISGTTNGTITLGMLDLAGFDFVSGVLATLEFVVKTGQTDLVFDKVNYTAEDISQVGFTINFTDGSVGQVGATMMLGDVVPTPGSTFSVPFTGKELVDISNFNLDISFDNTVLTFVDVENVVSGILTASADAGVLSLGYLNVAGLNVADGKIADLVFELSTGNSDLVFNDATAAIEDLDSNPITVEFVDGSVTESLANPPSFTSTMPDTTINESQLLEFLYTGTDVDGDSLIFSLTSGPAGATVDSTGQFAWTAPFGSEGVYTVVVKLTDDVFDVFDTTSVTVLNQETYVYTITEEATDGSLDNTWLFNYLSGAGTIIQPSYTAVLPRSSRPLILSVN